MFAALDVGGKRTVVCVVDAERPFNACEHQGVTGLGLDRGVIDQAQRGLKELSRRHEIA
ncbi:hypothetical protein I6F26_29230 [Ensifer sp. IC3342]|nr:hypothetical protein [Ensifer sp. IC3342]